MKSLEKVSKNLLGLREDQSPIAKPHKQVVPGGVVGILSLVYVHVGDYVVVMLVPYYIVDCAKQADQKLNVKDEGDLSAHVDFEVALFTPRLAVVHHYFTLVPTFKLRGFISKSYEYPV